MNAVITALKALLAPLGYAVYYVAVPSTPAKPYVLLWSSSGIAPVDQAVVGSSDITDTIGATAVADTAEGVLLVRERVRGVLAGARPTVAGRLVWLTLAGSEPTAMDTSVAPALAYGVDLYRLDSTPA